MLRFLDHIIQYNMVWTVIVDASWGPMVHRIGLTGLRVYMQVVQAFKHFGYLFDTRTHA